MIALPGFSVAGRVACVTGASSGLGAAAAQALAQAGAKVVGVARRTEPITAWAAETGGEVTPVSGDLADLDAIPGIASAVAEYYGPPDILVTAAGINTREAADEVTREGWQTTIDLNLSSPFFLAQALVPAMKAQGWGRIVNFASLQTERAFPCGVAYGASKAGIGQLTRAMAEAWSAEGINVNALAPGFFPTALTAAVFDDPDRAARNAEATCIGRNGEPADLVGPLLFLCSPASGYVTGQVLFVDGGYTAK